jgi:hypothetical protein
MTSVQQNEKQKWASPQTTPAFIVGLWGVRYQVKDVQRAITFYTQTLGFWRAEKGARSNEGIPDPCCGGPSIQRGSKKISGP